jgi:hypothetical protein
MIELFSKEYPEGEVRLYESVENAINAVTSEVQRMAQAQRYFDGLDELSIARIDSSKRDSQISVSEAKRLIAYNITAMDTAIKTGLSLNDSVKERTTDPITETATAPESDDQARREAYDKRLGAELAEAFGGVFADPQSGGTLPSMH